MSSLGLVRYTLQLWNKCGCLQCRSTWLSTFLTNLKRQIPEVQHKVYDGMSHTVPLFISKESVTKGSSSYALYLSLFDALLWLFFHERSWALSILLVVSGRDISRPVGTWEASFPARRRLLSSSCKRSKTNLGLRLKIIWSFRAIYHTSLPCVEIHSFD